MILGKPKDLDLYVCVNSNMSKKLHKLGFQPVYRELFTNKIYYLKNDNIIEILRKEENSKDEI